MKVSIGQRDKFPLMSEINMIPLIDVALVLLIIFMVVTPYLVSSQIKINLPRASSSVTAATTPIRIIISAQRNYYIEREMVGKKDLGTTLRLKLAGKENPTVLIEADAGVPFDLVVYAMDLAKANGAEKLGVSVQKN